MNIEKCYSNGNYIVGLFEDGTKIRYTSDDEFYPHRPESIDIKITNECNNNCSFCYEKSNNNGKPADLKDKIIRSFISSIPYGTELAIGGGNPLADVDFFNDFIKLASKQGLILNTTVHLNDFLKKLGLLQDLHDIKLLHGIGISITNSSMESLLKAIPRILKCSPDFRRDFVFHVVIDYVDFHNLEIFAEILSVSGFSPKVLFLGNKNKFKLKNLKNRFTFVIDFTNITKDMSVVSFDCNAVKIAKKIAKLTKNKNLLKAIESNFMGSDGDFTYYVDLVNKTYHVSSSDKQNSFSILEEPNCIDQFQNIQKYLKK